MKPANLKSSLNIEYGVEHNDRDPKFKLGKGYTPNWPEEVSVFKKVNNIVPWIYLLVKKLLEYIMKKKCERQAKKNLGLKK